MCYNKKCKKHYISNVNPPYDYQMEIFCID